MERIGNQKIWSYYDDSPESQSASNTEIRGGTGHEVQSYIDLAQKVADLNFRNRDHVLLFRGQNADHKNRDRKSTRLNSSHQIISYAVFCLKKKKLERFGPQLEADVFDRTAYPPG